MSESSNKAKIKEIFSSIQGEGIYIGTKQLFIRFCGCNLDCNYCDTTDSENQEFFEFSPTELYEHIQQYKLKSLHSISLTGGEPLIWSNFLAEFLPLFKHDFNPKIYLETNSTLKNNLEKIIDYVDIISADIKLPSSSGVENSFAFHDEFFKTANQHKKEIFAKIVFDENILDDEINHCLKLAEKYNLELILQPKTLDDKVAVDGQIILDVFNKFLVEYPRVRIIPQVHKFLGVE